MLRAATSTLLVAVLPLAAACTCDVPAEPLEPAQSAQAQLPAASENDMTIEDIVLGAGEECRPGATVTIHYAGTLLDGTEFDSSLADDPATFPLGRLIEGWQRGIPGMRVGGKRRLTIPPALGYGSRDIRDDAGRVIIPGGSTLVFEIELLGVRNSP